MATTAKKVSNTNTATEDSTVKDSMVGLIKDSGDIANTIVNTISGLVANLASNTE